MSVRNTVRVAAGIVSVSTFVLLYVGLVDLARLAGIHDFRSWLYPLAIDGMVAAAYAATLALSGHALAFAWFVVGVGSAMSLVGQWLHAASLTAWEWAGPVAAAPALSMALVWHLMWLVVKRQEPTPDTVTEPTEEPTEEPTPVAEPTPEPTPPTPPTPKAAKPVASRPRADHEVRAIALLAEARGRGVALTGRQMAVELGVTERTGQRWLKRAEEALAQTQAA